MGRLLETDFPGCEALRGQLLTLRVLPIDGDGSLKLSVTGGDRAPVVRRVPVEAEMADVDGVPIHVLLHVVDGCLDELEVFREDSGRPKGKVRPESLSILVL